MAADLPGRPWFKHAIYAPGVTTGYGAWPLPAIRQVLEEKKPERLRPLATETAASIDTATAALLEGSGSRHGRRGKATNR